MNNNDLNLEFITLSPVSFLTMLGKNVVENFFQFKTSVDFNSITSRGLGFVLAFVIIGGRSLGSHTAVL